MTLRDRLWLYFHGYCAKHLIKKEGFVGCIKCYMNKRNRELEEENLESIAESERLLEIKIRERGPNNGK